MKRLTIILTDVQKAALWEFALSEFRDPRTQAVYIIQQELERRGLLPSAEQDRQTLSPALAEEARGDIH